MKHFWIPSLDLLKQYIIRHEQKYAALDEQFAYVQTAFESLASSSHTATPKLQLFEQQSGIKILFDDIVSEITSQ
ncbi:hypothetical protein KAZ93_01475 [Patescibacteria group bacterium]|nr:hypothetical protein [Patescibacteria group bacterium]